jgi:hypothetical protein
MKERIKAHLNSLFEGTLRTRRIDEMYQELLAGCQDKYDDLTAGGMDGEEAYAQVIDGIGDVSELLGYIEKAKVFDPTEAAERRQKRAFFTSAGICGYFIAVAVFLLLVFSDQTDIGLAIMLALAGIATMVLIYGRMTTVVEYEKVADTMVEEMKVQMTSGKREQTRENKLASLASSTMWTFVVIIYLALSFITFRWDITWIIFLIAAVLQNFIMARFKRVGRNKYLTGAFWSLAVTLYFIISFWTFAWHITWIIFPLAAAVQQAVKLFRYWREAE